jgi:hypothetical protein
MNKTTGVKINATLLSTTELVDFIKEFQLLDSTVFLEFTTNGEIVAKYINSGHSVLRYNSLPMENLIEFDTVLDKRIGVGVHTMKKVIGALKMLSTEKNITIEFNCYESEIENYDGYEARTIILKSDNFKKIAIPLANSTLINYVPDDTCNNILKPEGSFATALFTTQLMKKMTSIIDFDETIHSIGISGVAGSNSLLFKLDDKYTIEHTTNVDVTQNVNGFLEASILKRIKEQDYKFTIDDVKVTLIADNNPSAYVFSLDESEDHEG